MLANKREMKLRGKSANQIKNMLLAESIQKQRANSERDAHLQTILNQRTEWVRATSEVRELQELQESQNFSSESSFKATIKRTNLNVSLGNINDDLRDFTYNAEAVITDAR